MQKHGLRQLSASFHNASFRQIISKLFMLYQYSGADDVTKTNLYYWIL